IDDTALIQNNGGVIRKPADTGESRIEVRTNSPGGFEIAEGKNAVLDIRGHRITNSPVLPLPPAAPAPGMGVLQTQSVSYDLASAVQIPSPTDGNGQLAGEGTLSTP